jgi:segregation and condensation protein B
MTADLPSLLESILFVSAEPVPLERLRSALGCSAAELDAALTAVGEQLEGRGVRLQRGADGAQLVTAPEHAEQVEKFLGIQVASQPSAAALETLAIIAYRQPISRPRIEEIRGVNSDRVLRTLVAQGLVEEVGRAPSLGRPVLYGTTPDFLQRFGLASLGELPALEDVEDVHHRGTEDTEDDGDVKRKA